MNDRGPDWARQTGEELKDDPPQSNGNGTSQAKPIKAHRFVWRAPNLIPRRAWLYPGLYVRQFVSVTIAAGAVGKTGECAVEAIALVLARDLLKVGHRFPAGKPRRVWYWNGEDPLVEMERQVHAIARLLPARRGRPCRADGTALPRQWTRQRHQPGQGRAARHCHRQCRCQAAARRHHSRQQDRPVHPRPAGRRRHRRPELQRRR